MSKTDSIRAFKEANPDATYSVIADKFQCSYSTIARALAKEPLLPKTFDSQEDFPGIDGDGRKATLCYAKDLCPKTWDYLQSQLLWAVKNKRKWLCKYLKECVKEMTKLV